MNFATEEYFNIKRMGVIFLDDEFYITYISAMADKFLRINRVVEVRGLRFRGIKPRDDSKIQNAMSGCLRHQKRNTIFLKPVTTSVPIRIDIVPILEDSSVGNSNDVLCLVLASVNNHGIFLSKKFADYYKLTPSEAALTDSLFLKRSLRDHSAHRKTAYDTTRSTLRDIYRKTETHARSELLELIHMFSD